MPSLTKMYRARLDRIALIIEIVDTRCMAVDGPVTPTKEEITKEELIEIYELATFKRNVNVS